MVNVKRYLLSLAGALACYIVIAFLGGGLVGALLGAVAGVPLGVLGGMLVVDLPRSGFTSRHAVGFLISLVANLGVVMFLHAYLSYLPSIIWLLFMVTTCLACYWTCEKLLSKVGEAQ